MIKIIIKELAYFSIILVVLALIQHSDLLSSPLVRLDTMSAQGNYLHPFAWSALVYGIVWGFRLIIKFIIYLKNRVSKD